MQEMHKTQVQTLSQEDILEYGVATHSTTLAWKIPWTEKSGRQESTVLTCEYILGYKQRGIKVAGELRNQFTLN